MIPSLLFFADILPIKLFRPGTWECFSLQAEALVHGVGLTQHTICHVVAIIYPRSLIQHVIRLGGFGVVGVVGINITSDIGQ